MYCLWTQMHGFSKLPQEIMSTRLNLLLFNYLSSVQCFNRKADWNRHKLALDCQKDCGSMNHSSNKTASYPRRSKSSLTPLWQPQILHLITCFVATSWTAKKPVFCGVMGPQKWAIQVTCSGVYFSILYRKKNSKSHYRNVSHAVFKAVIPHQNTTELIQSGVW